MLKRIDDVQKIGHKIFNFNHREIKWILIGLVLCNVVGCENGRPVASGPILTSSNIPLIDTIYESGGSVLVTNAGNGNAISVFREKRFNKPGFDAILNGVKEIVVVVGLFKFKLVGWRCFRVIQQEVVHIVFLVRNEIAIVVIVCVLFCAKHNGADAIHV